MTPPLLYDRHDYSSTQFDLPADLAERVRRLAEKIPDEDLAEDGREDHIHVTVKYGLHTADPLAVDALVSRFGPVTIRLGKVGLFLAKEASAQRGGAQYDVVKIDIESESLCALNRLLSDSLPHTDTHPEYQPHVTLAYVQPGRGKDYVGAHPLEGWICTLADLTFSDPEGETTLLALDDDKSPLAYASDDEGLTLYALSTEELLQYGSEDWDGPHQGKGGGIYWVSNKGKHRRVYSTENPGAKGDAHRKRLEENRTKKTAKQEEGKQQRAKQQEQRGQTRAKLAQQKEQAKAQQAESYAGHLQAAHEQIAALMQQAEQGERPYLEVAPQLNQLFEHLKELKVKDIQTLKAKYGLVASGAKAEQAYAVAKQAMFPAAQRTLPRGQKRPTAPAAAPQGPAPWEGGQVEPGKVYNAPTQALAVDPTRFQFKLNTDASGVTDELKDVKTFNPDFAGVVSVWQDPADGKTYVVNGHHRHELASRTGHPDLAVRYVQAATAKEARAVGALVNIAEGRGTAIDAAKFMRDMGVDPAGLEKYGVSLKGKLAQDATALVNLNDRQFDRLARGLLAPEKALAVAKHLKNPELQDQLFRLLEQREESGKDLSPRVIEEMAREMAETPTQSKTEASLFGDIESEESLFVPRNELKAHVRGELSREVRDFLAVASKRRAGRVEGAGNILNVEENKRIAEEAARVQHVYEKLANRKGAVSDALNEAAAALASGKSKGGRDAAKKRAVEAVRSAVFAEAGVGSGAGGGEAQPGGVASGGAGSEPPGEAQPAAPAAADTGQPAADGGGATEQPAGVSEAPQETAPAGGSAADEEYNEETGEWEPKTTEAQAPAEKPPQETPTAAPKEGDKEVPVPAPTTGVARPTISEDEIPYDTAYNAHRNTSFVPEVRAKQRQKDYAETMNGDFDELSKFAGSPEKQEQLAQEFERYRQGFRERFLAYLHAGSRVASSMITGPANFPTAQNEKRGDTLHRRLTELLDFRKRALQAIQRKLTPERGPIKSADPEAVTKIQTKLAQHEALHERMRKVNDAHKRFLKDPASLDQSDLSDEDKARVRNYQPAYSWEPHPFPPYALTNNGAEIRRLKARAGEVATMQAGEHKQEQWGDIKVTEDPGSGRIRLHFPGKPDRDTISAMKAAGFKWSPSEGAWQRHLNNAGRYAAKNVLERLGKQKTGETAGQAEGSGEWEPPAASLLEAEEKDVGEQSAPNQASPGASGSSPAAPEKPAATSSHATALAALPVGDLQRVGGFNVRRVGENDYRIETPTGQRGSAVQSGTEKDTGHVRGDAKRIAAYIEEQTKQQGLHGRARTEALDRVKDYGEPSFLDAAGQERAQQGFAALPEGAAVVSLEEGTHGRTGKIVKDSAGKNRVQLDGEDGFASGYVEPLDARQSWRAPEQKEAGPKQAGLFEAPAAPAPRPAEQQRTGVAAGPAATSVPAGGGAKNPPPSAPSPPAPSPRAVASSPGAALPSVPGIKAAARPTPVPLAALTTAYRGLQQGGTGRVRLPDLYDAVKRIHPEITPEGFAAHMEQLEREDKIHLGQVNDPRLEPRANEFLRDAKDGSLRGYVLLRPTTAKPATVASAPAPHHATVLDAFRRLDKGNNYVDLADLRDHLAKQGLAGRKEQDAVIQDLRKKGVLSLSSYEGREGLSPRQQAAALREEGTLLGGVSVRPGAENPGKSPEPRKTNLTADKPEGRIAPVASPSTGGTKVSEQKQPWDRSAQEYDAEFAAAKEAARTPDGQIDWKLLKERGFTGYRDQDARAAVVAAIKAGQAVPQDVIDRHAATVEEAAKVKLRAEFGADYIDRLRASAKTLTPLHETVRRNENGTVTVRQKQLSGGGFQAHAKGDFVLDGDAPKVVTKALKPYKGKHDGETTGYFQELSLRDPKPAELARIEAAKAAREAIAQHDGQSNNTSYPDLKRQQMTEHERLVRAALGAQPNA